MGNSGWLRSSAWIWALSPTQSARALSGGFRVSGNGRETMIRWRAMDGQPFPRLFSPLRLGPALTLRNRVVLSPHTTNFADPGGYPSVRDAEYQAARARGGLALSVMG